MIAALVVLQFLWAGALWFLFKGNYAAYKASRSLVLASRAMLDGMMILHKEIEALKGEAIEGFNKEATDAAS